MRLFLLLWMETKELDYLIFWCGRSVLEAGLFPQFLNLIWACDLLLLIKCEKCQNASFKPQGALHVSALLLAILLSPGKQGQTGLLEDETMQSSAQWSQPRSS